MSAVRLQLLSRIFCASLFSQIVALIPPSSLVVHTRRWFGIIGNGVDLLSSRLPFWPSAVRQMVLACLLPPDRLLLNGLLLASALLGARSLVVLPTTGTSASGRLWLARLRGHLAIAWIWAGTLACDMSSTSTPVALRVFVDHIEMLFEIGEVHRVVMMMSAC